MSAKQLGLLVSVLLVAMAARGLAQTPGGKAEGRPSLTDFSGMWVHPYFPGIEPPASGPGPVFNRLHRPDGTGSGREFVGDYTNPILKPEAAAIVKRHGNITLGGITCPTSS